MSQPDEQTVRAVLQRNDRGLRLRQALMGAWETCGKLYPSLGWWRRKSTRAAVMWEHSVQNAVATLADDPGVRPIHHHDTMSFVVDDAILIRVKKVSIELRSSNVQTTLASLFHCHQAELFGDQGLQRVELGYMLNRFESRPIWIGIVAREQKAELFHFELNELAVSAAPLELPAQIKRAPAELATIKKDAAKTKGDKEE